MQPSSGGSASAVPRISNATPQTSTRPATKFAERNVTYDYADLSELSLAWAVTVHKSQGSEYAVVVFPLFMQHYVLLSRNLLYTGLTRAKQLAILVGPTKAIGMAVKRIMDRQRYTALAERLKRLEHGSLKVYEQKY